MPRGDGTGPMGLGPGIGRGPGFCAGFPDPWFAIPGRRRGTRSYPGTWWQPGPASKEEEVRFLKQKAQVEYYSNSTIESIEKM